MLKEGGQSYRLNDSTTFTGVQDYYQGKDRSRLIVLSDCARPLSYERKFATFGCKGTTNFPHTQENRQFYCRFSIYGVLFAVSYNYTLAQFHSLKMHANALRVYVYASTQRVCSLASGILTKSVSLLFSNSVHNLTNIFLYFRRKSHGCVRVRTRNYFLYFYIISIYY